MPFNGSPEELQRAEIVDSTGSGVGKVEQIFLTKDTGVPSWATVNTGFFGTKETFVPLAEAEYADGRITVPYEKAFIKDAPTVEGDQEITRDQERELYRYYGLDEDSLHREEGRRQQGAAEGQPGQPVQDGQRPHDGHGAHGGHGVRGDQHAHADQAQGAPVQGAPAPVYGGHAGEGRDDRDVDERGLGDRNAQGRDELRTDRDREEFGHQGQGVEGRQDAGHQQGVAGQGGAQEDVDVHEESVEGGAGETVRLRRYTVTEVVEEVPVENGEHPDARR